MIEKPETTRPTGAGAHRRRNLLGLSAQAPAQFIRFASERSRMLFHRRAREPGERQGTMRIAADASPPRIHAISYDPDRLEEHEIEDVEILKPFAEAPGVVWVDVMGFGDESTLRRIGGIFGVHRLAMADVVNVPQQPKLEDYDDRHLSSGGSRGNLWCCFRG